MTDSNEKNDGIVADRLEVEPGWCCNFGGVTMANAYNWLGTARGPIVMSNIFLSTALIYLASAEVGCVEEGDDGDMQVVDDCQERVYGAFRPSALITNIAVISGVLSAIFMPVAGAIIDFTPNRWITGVVSAALITLVQMIQIGTGSNNWFPMAILQALAGCLYQVQVLATYAYLPDMARKVTDQSMTHFSTVFTMVQFGSQVVFLFLVVGVSTSLDFGEVKTARLSQALNSVNIVISFVEGWRLMPKVPARNVLEKGKSLLLQGFVQNWNTAKRINRDYRKSVKWFLLGVLFAEPAANAFTVVSVVFMSDQLKMSGSEIGIIFFVVLIGMLPGGLIHKLVANSTNANTSIRLSMLMLFILSVIGGLCLTQDNVYPVAFIWAFTVGLMLGWYYPTLQLFLSLVVPHGQEAELTGFFVYCTQILVWLPPLLFSGMVEAEVDQGVGIIVVGCFFLISIAVFSMAAPFDELLEEVRSNDEKKLKEPATPEFTNNSNGVAA